MAHLIHLLEWLLHLWSLHGHVHHMAPGMPWHPGQPVPNPPPIPGPAPIPHCTPEVCHVS